MMKPRILFWWCFLLTSLAAHGSERMHVQVQSAQIRENASFLARTAGTLPYGSEVTVIQIQGDWRQIQAQGAVEGWLHQSALSKKKIAMRPGSQDVGTTADSDELALAGKGFNAQVEADFKAKNEHIDFTWIDRMEAFTVPQQELKRFLAEGQITPPNS
jgi:uncharacterized protein YgiM (DUF1202 family)